MNKKGIISVEALISVTVFIFFGLFLSGMIHFIGIHDYMSQEVLKEIEMVSLYNYGYESIGVISLEELSFLKNKWPPELDFLLEAGFDNFEENQKNLALRTILSVRLKALEKHSQIDQVKIKSFKLEDDILKLKITYEQRLPLNFKVKQNIESEQLLWFLGNNKGLIDLQTLADILSEKKKTLRTVSFMSQKLA